MKSSKLVCFLQWCGLASLKLFTVYSRIEQIGKYIVDDETQTFLLPEKGVRFCKYGRWERLEGALWGWIGIAVIWMNSWFFICRYRNRCVYVRVFTFIRMYFLALAVERAEEQKRSSSNEQTSCPDHDG